MQYPEKVLEQQNAALLAGAYILPKIRPVAEATAKRLLASRSRFETIQNLTTVPALVTAAILERECDGNFKCAMCNGEEIIGTGHRTTLVPRNRGPYATFEEGAEDALHLDGLDAVAKRERWTQEVACYYWEAYNGFGVRAHGRHTGYVWAGTNIYNGGKYVRDGVWDPNAWDTQLGTVAIMMAMAEIAPDLALPRGLPTVTAHTEVPAPLPVPEGHGTKDMTAAEIQQALNSLGCHPPLLVDGNLGRITRMAVRSFQEWKGLELDGLVGELTRNALWSTLADRPLGVVSGRPITK